MEIRDTQKSPRQPLSKSAYVLEVLQQELSDGRLKAGEAIVQEDVAKRLGVSQTPVREALRSLEASGAVVYVPHRGATVADMPAEAVVDLYYARAELEALVTKMAAERWNEEQMADLERRHRELSGLVQTGQHELMVTLNRELHFAIFAAGSPTIAPQIHVLWKSFPFRANRRLWEHADNVAEFIRWHGRILEALRSRDATGAADLMRQHVLEVAGMRGLPQLTS